MPRKETGPKSRRRLSSAQRRERIVDAALRTFSRHGYRGATTRQLARAARITEVTLFRYFVSKEKLFAAVLEKYSILPVLQAEMVRPPPRGRGRATLRQVGRRFLKILKEREHLIRLMLSESVVNPRQARMMFRQGPGRFVQDTAKLLAMFHERGEIRRVDFTLASRAVLGVFFSFFLMQEILLGRESEPLDLDQATGQLSDLLWRGLRRKSPTRKRGKRS